MANNQSQEAVLHITDSEFASVVLTDKRPVVVDFYSESCPPCLMMGPALEKLAWEFRHKIRVIKVCTDHHKERAKSYRLSSVPSLLFFLNGEVVDTQVGYENYASLREQVDDFVSRYAGGKSADAVEQQEEFVFEKAFAAAEKSLC